MWPIKEKENRELPMLWPNLVPYSKLQVCVVTVLLLTSTPLFSSSQLNNIGQPRRRGTSQCCRPPKSSSSNSRGREGGRIYRGRRENRLQICLHFCQLICRASLLQARCNPPTTLATAQGNWRASSALPDRYCKGHRSTGVGRSIQTKL